MPSDEVNMNPGNNVFLLLSIGVAIGFFGSLLVRALAKDTELPKDALCLSKENEDGRLKVTWDGQVVSMASALTFEQRSQVQRLALDLNAWLGNPIVGQPPPPAEVVAEPLPFALPSPILFTSSGTSQPAVVAPTPTASTLPLVASALPRDPGPEKPLKFSMNPVDMVKTVQGNWDKSKNSAVGSKSIIAEVDTILQNKIIGTPFEKRGIRLLEKPDHTMLIEIGLNKYDGIEAIPSEEIRELIRTCVSEWTLRSTRVG
jgi:hypothetical protein